MSNMILTDLILWTLVLSSPLGDPSLRGGNGIPPRCVYLEEMAADLDGQDWLDMDNIEQVRCQCVFKAVLPMCFFSISHRMFGAFGEELNFKQH